MYRVYYPAPMSGRSAVGLATQRVSSFFTVLPAGPSDFIGLKFSPRMASWIQEWKQFQGKPEGLLGRWTHRQ